MLYFWQMASDPLRETVAVNTDNITDLQRELERARERLHEHESRLASVALLSQMVHELKEQLPALARRAAREAVAEDRRVRHRDWYSNLRTYAAVATVGVALGALIVGLVLR